MNDVTAFVPMRHESERVPGKNFRLFHGRPLFHYVLEALSKVDAITKIVVDTDSPMIRESCNLHFPNITCVERPLHLRDGRIPMTDVLQHDARLFPSDWYLQTHSTNPLLKHSTIARALDCLQKESSRHDSLFSVSRLQARLYDAVGKPINHNPKVLLRTQDLPPVLMENSNLYIFTSDQIERGQRFGERPLMLEMDPVEATDIDNQRDFELAEALFSLISRTQVHP